MNNLTEQWKNGELEDGAYYYIKINNKTIPAKLSKYGNFYLTEGACGRNAMRNVEEVLAEVPDYLEWRNYVNGYCEEHNYNLKLQEENAKLKELLKEWVKFYPIVLYEYEDTLKTKDIIELREKTVEVIDD